MNNLTLQKNNLLLLASARISNPNANFLSRVVKPVSAPISKNNLFLCKGVENQAPTARPIIKNGGDELRSQSAVAKAILPTQKAGGISKNNKINVPSSYKPQTQFGMKSKGFKSEGLKVKRVLSLSQIMGRIRQKRQKKLDQQKTQKPVKPIIPPKSLIIVLKDKPKKAVYNQRIIDYKHCGLLQSYIGLGGKILPRRQTRLTAKQQRYVAKTIKSARIMGLLPFVSKERGFFR